MNEQEALERLKDYQEQFETIKDTYPEESRIINLNQTNHEILIQALLNSAINQSPLYVQDTIVYVPYTVDRIQAWLKQNCVWYNRDEANLRDKMRRLILNWEFIWEANDIELPSQMLAYWSRRQGKMPYRITIYGIDISRSFAELIDKTTERARELQRLGVTNAATRRSCMTSNYGVEVAKRAHSQQDVELNPVEEQTRRYINSKAGLMLREHDVVTLDGLIEYLLNDEVSRNHFMEIKVSVRSIVQGHIPGVCKRFDLCKKLVSHPLQHQYPYLQNDKLRSTCYLKG